MPYYRLGSPPEDIFIVNYKGERLKEIDTNIFNQLEYETEFAPVRYQNALKAFYKLQEWKEDDYGRLSYKYTLKSNGLAASIL